MKSVKPGRGPSFMGGVMSLLFGVFGIIWTIIAASAGGGPFALFGVVLIAVAVIQAIYHFKNATGKNRYSAYDITEQGEEPDPLNERFGGETEYPAAASTPAVDPDSAFCPYCGTPVAGDFEFCNKCGKKLP